MKKDGIKDKWVVDSDCYRNRSLCNETADYQPVIGILTMPVGEDKKDLFNNTDYILEINDNILRWGGSKTVAIPYNISESELFSLLRQINGVLFTGGGLTLVEQVNKTQHPYYVTARKIFSYSKYMKEIKNEEWPILGICQGLEVISIILNDDNPDVLDKIFIYGQNRPIHWTVPYNETQLWNTLN